MFLITSSWASKLLQGVIGSSLAARRVVKLIFGGQSEARLDNVRRELETSVYKFGDNWNQWCKGAWARVHQQRRVRCVVNLWVKVILLV